MHNLSRWTAEIDETVRSLWTNGVSATECVKRVETEHNIIFSRMAIIGRSRRRGWKTPNAPRAVLGERKPSAATKTRVRISRRAMREREAIALEDYRSGERAPSVRDAPPRRRIATDAPASRNLMLADLGPHDCRYATSPHQSHAHLFCGAQAADESAYCAHHLALCHRRAA